MKASCWLSANLKAQPVGSVPVLPLEQVFVLSPMQLGSKAVVQSARKIAGQYRLPSNRLLVENGALTAGGKSVVQGNIYVSSGIWTTSSSCSRRDQS